MTKLEILTFAACGIEARRYSIKYRPHTWESISPEKLRDHAKELEEIEAKYVEINKLIQEHQIELDNIQKVCYSTKNSNGEIE